MNVLEFTGLIAAGSFLAGFLGAITGLGGGVVIVPLLSLALGVDIRYAVGASLVSVIATSSGAAAAYVKEGFTNVRIGSFLEIATSAGALTGAWLATRLPVSAIGVTFGAVLLYSANHALRPSLEDFVADRSPDRWGTLLRLHGTCPGSEGPKSYTVRAVPLGFAVMGIAGILSGLLGIGSGAVKVIAMDQIMRIPFKVSTTTSNFMIGVTAAASVGVYLSRGYIDPGLAMPVVLGVLSGSLLGARILTRASTPLLRKVFSAAISVLALEMIYNSLAGRL
jgi:uncharacterized membrane protein YfcA